jgi:Zn-dependent M32 family carboxypeptidase
MDKRSWLDLFGVRHPDFNSNPQYLSAQIERAFNSVIAYAFRNDYSSFDLYTKSYPNIAVATDTYGTYYSTVPVRLVQLKDNAESVRRIHALKDQLSILFVPIPKDSWSTFNLLDVSKVSKYVGYSITNNRVEYSRHPSVSTVTMDLVRAFMDYEDNEEIPMPSGMEQMFEQLVQSFLQGTPPPNKLNV